MDVGELALEEIHKRLLIDEAWTWRRPRGFTWIAHRLIQSTGGLVAQGHQPVCHPSPPRRPVSTTITSHNR